MSRSCKANTTQGASSAVMSKASKSMNATAWEGHSNDKQFMEALSKFMNESWAAVCQLRERSGLNSSYEMSSNEISKRINDVSKKLEDKYKEVQVLESQKAQLLNKSSGPSGSLPANFQPVASSTPANQLGYSGNYNMTYSGSGSSGWPSTSGGSSARKQLQFTSSSGGSSSCAPTCPGTSVKMNDEEKQQKMNEIVKNLFEQYSEEASSINSSANDTVYQTALDSTAYETAHNTAFILPSTSSSFRPRATSSPCPCAPDTSKDSRNISRGRRADTPRPGSSPVRGRVATPDQYFVPLAQSSLNTEQCPAYSPAMAAAGSSRSRGARGRSESPYSTLIDSGGPPYAYQSGTPLFAGLTSESGRGLSSYSNNSSGPLRQGAWSGGGWSGSECPRECSIGSVNSTGRAQLRQARGQPNPWDWRQVNRTV